MDGVEHRTSHLTGAAPTLLIGNSRTEEMVGMLAALSPVERQFGGAAAVRTLWYAHSGDVLVLPFPPRPEYLGYVTALTGADPESLAILVPPPGDLGSDLLTPDRTADPDFRAAVREVVRQRGVEQVLAVYTDVPITQFAESVGLSVPGHPFSAQGGDALINSKAGFRAVAAGSGAPIAPGLVASRPAEAAQLVSELLEDGHSAIVKREFTGGGLGNEILSRASGVRVAGAPREVVLPDAAAVADYFEQRWPWLSDGGRHRVVVEQYLAGCDTVYAEYLIRDDGPQLSGVGELLMAPVAVGQVVPAQVLTPAALALLLRAGAPLTRAVHAMGYRGYLSTDAVLTPAGEVYLTETNGRVSGSTHLHVSIEARVLAAEHRGDRVLLEHFGWKVPSFGAAIDALTDAGLCFDVTTGTGVVLTSDLLPDGTVTYCVVAAALDQAQTVRRRLPELVAAADTPTWAAT